MQNYCVLMHTLIAFLEDTYQFDFELQIAEYGVLRNYNVQTIIGGVSEMTTEIKRDLAADLAICEAAISGPWHSMPSVHSEYPYEVCRSDFLDTIVASAITEDDARFIAAAREGWPHAIRRAIAGEAELERLRTGITDAVTYPSGIVRAKLRKLLTEVSENAAS